ncbi:carbon-nitrogen hydrolase family protein [Mesorhizobium neociceri]|uniref:Carbon-nitrogen hydrolase family protein n=1 Tax=Mesorhizobium neociceri TaxID=1307853 RepID=A0A838BF90_9HYPH|nr:carbon-nitrogen hydrolase family protein [Mesorhizobium neociceri]MBA1145155.1 carbon-nitrogen hydrolase family protein [Mesorhizobium neociceri]
MDTRIAISQKPPALLDLEATYERAIASIAEAAAEGAKLIVFPEAYLPGYPTWIWRLRPGGDMTLANSLHAKLRRNAVDVSAGGLDRLREAAAQYGMIVVMGLNEIDSQCSGSTLYNTVVTIGSDGSILNRHRKLMPTNPERMVWGFGDASGLRVVETPIGRVGSLICWESYMPLARFALYAQNIDIYVAPTWDSGETWLATMKHIAREGGCWVLSTATALEAIDIPEDFPDRSKLFAEDEWINPGDAVVVNPFGGVAAGPLHRVKGILYADLDVDAARAARRSLDVAGHYGRPDIFRLEVDRKPRLAVHFDDGTHDLELGRPHMP